MFVDQNIQIPKAVLEDDEESSAGEQVLSPPPQRKFDRLGRGKGGDIRQKELIGALVEHTPMKRRAAIIDEEEYADGLSENGQSFVSGLIHSFIPLSHILTE